MVRKSASNTPTLKPSKDTARFAVTVDFPTPFQRHTAIIFFYSGIDFPLISAFLNLAIDFDFSIRRYFFKIFLISSSARFDVHRWCV
jgi:hypothetical protein